MGKVSDAVVILALMLMLGYVGINIDPELANAFNYLILLSFALLVFEYIPGLGDRRIVFPVVNDNNKFINSMIITVITYFGFLLVTSLFVGVLFPGSFSASPTSGDAFSLTSNLILSEKEAVLAGNQPVTNFNFGTVIPITETITFFGFVFEFMLLMFFVKSNKLNPKIIGIIILIALMFAAFHLNAKASSPDISPPLFVVFMFGLISLFMVFFTKQKFEAILLHILANTSVLTGSILIGLVVTAVVGYLINQSPKIRLGR